ADHCAGRARQGRGSNRGPGSRHDRRGAQDLAVLPRPASRYVRSPREGLMEGVAMTSEQFAAAFAEIHPPFAPQEALVEANRCLFCVDAPCTAACPTHIDV